MNHKDIFVEDLNAICQSAFINFGCLENKTVLVTGATGLIGFTLVNALLHYGRDKAHGPKVIALVRNIEKAEAMYADIPYKELSFLVSDIRQPIHLDRPVDYMIHGASQTSSKAFVDEPVETIKTAIEGTIHMLELAKAKRVKSFVYLSSMEIYGAPETDEKMKEDQAANLNTMAVRASYPESKRMCETLCTAYCAEYGVPVKVIRLTQTFGPGVSYNDGRVFAEFVRCVIEKKNIVLHTKGETKRNYLYTADAATAILTVLLKGENGEAYNAANEDTYCSIYEMAQTAVNACANGTIQIEIQADDSNKFGYAPVLKMNLDTSKLRNLGWKADRTLAEMFQRLCDTI